MIERKWIERVSRRFAALCLWMGFAIVTAVGTYWWLVEPASATIWLSGVAQPQVLSFEVRSLAFLITMVPTLAVLAGLAYLHRLFRLYATGIIFGEGNVAALRGLSLSCIAFAIADVAFRPLLALVLTMNNPPGERFVTVALSSGSIMALVFGGVLWVIVRVMDEARKIDEEQAWTV